MTHTTSNIETMGTVISNTEIKSIYTHREEVLDASEFISKNRASSYIGMKGSNSYYNVNGIVWEVWQDGCGNYPTSKNLPITEFAL